MTYPACEPLVVAVEPEVLGRVERGGVERDRLSGPVDHDVRDDSLLILLGNRHTPTV